MNVQGMGLRVGHADVESTPVMMACCLHHLVRCTLYRCRQQAQVSNHPHLHLVGVNDVLMLQKQALLW